MSFLTPVLILPHPTLALCYFKGNPQEGGMQGVGQLGLELGLWPQKASWWAKQDSSHRVMPWLLPRSPSGTSVLYFLDLDRCNSIPGAACVNGE